MTDPLIDWIDGKAYFRNLPVVQHILTIAGRDFTIHALRDAADLLDQPDFAKEFVENDVAPYGMELWPAARMLAEHVLDDENGDGRSAIELGCGLGLVSIAAASKGWRVLATDNEATSLRFAKLNATENGVQHVVFELLDWMSPPQESSYDRVFAADILYQAVDHEPILRCLDTLLAVDGVALIADPNRSVADRFPALAGDFSFVVETTPTRSIQSDGRHVAGRMHVLTRRN